MLKIYLTDLAAYNKGYLHGEWVLLPMEEDKLQTTLLKILDSGSALCFMESGFYDKHEEYFITDWEWTEHEFQEISEYENIYELNKMLELLHDKSEYELKAISFLVTEGLAQDIEEAISKADDVIIHENQNMEDVAYDLMQECYQADLLPSIIANNISYEGIAKDLEHEGTYYVVGSDIFEFAG